MFAGLAWAVAVAVGFTQLYRYKAEPAGQKAAPARWPKDSGLRRSPDRATLLLFAHPGCPCTRASLSELARLMTREAVRVAAQVVVVEPRITPASWTDSAALRERAASIPGVAVVRDEDGLEAARFNAGVSGFVVLYDARGSRLFSGGITPSRGHEGDSFGRRRIRAALEGRAPDLDTSPVYGCALALRDDGHHAAMDHEGASP